MKLLQRYHKKGIIRKAGVGLENVVEDISSFRFSHRNLCLCFSQCKLKVGGHEMNIDYCRDDISRVNEDELI